jgi:D-alanyl-D-alanine carboxypeptidase
MLNEKRIKLLIIISLLVIEIFVWTANGAGSSWSLGFFGDPDGSGTILEDDGSSRSEEDDNGKPDGEEPLDDEEPIDGSSDEGNPTDEENPPDGGNESEGSSQNGGFAETLNEAEKRGLLILVNKEHAIDRDYKPSDLVKIRYFASDRSEATRYMRAEAAEAFHRLVEKAAEEGIELKMTTAYRSYAFQKILFDSYVEKEGEEAANTYSARPGQSEHQTGLAVDVSSPSVGYQLTGEYSDTKEGKWLAEHAHKFGFIIRFPKGKEDITGYQYEPWHIRYVGLAAAREIRERNLTLEEFLQEYGRE